MEVLILSKTKYGPTQFCVGGICVITKQFVRLLNQGGYYQPASTQFNIGDIWDISFTPTTFKKEPHNEDVTIHSYKFIRKVYQLETYIKNMGVAIWNNSIANIFEGKILWQKNGKGYFSENIKNYPNHSVGFWISDVDLRHQKVGQQDLYIYENNGLYRQIVYKGNQSVISVIPKGKLIRLSLAKWWKPEDSIMEARCYLQLSGWYEDQAEPAKKVESSLSIDKTPFVIPQITTKSYDPPKYEAPLYQATKTIQPPKNTNGSCYIATLCYGDYYADEVCSFRDFRDASLSKTKLGRGIITYYYQFAPQLTKKLENCGILNRLIKHIILNPLLITIRTFKYDKT